MRFNPKISAWEQGLFLMIGLFSLYVLFGLDAVNHPLLFFALGAGIASVHLVYCYGVYRHPGWEIKKVNNSTQVVLINLATGHSYQVSTVILRNSFVLQFAYDTRYNKRKKMTIFRDQLPRELYRQLFMLFPEVLTCRRDCPV